MFGLLVAASALAQEKWVPSSELETRLAGAVAREGPGFLAAGTWDTIKAVKSAAAAAGVTAPAARVSDSVPAARVELESLLKRTGARCAWLVVPDGATTVSIHEIGTCRPKPPPAPAVARPAPAEARPAPALAPPPPTPSPGGLGPTAKALVDELMAMPDHDVRMALLAAKLGAGPDPAQSTRIGAVLSAITEMKQAGVSERSQVAARLESALLPLERRAAAPVVATPAAPVPAPSPPDATDPLTHLVVRWADIADGRAETLEEGFIGAYETQFDYTVRLGDVVAVNVPTGASARVTGSALGGGTSGVGAAVVSGTAVQSSWFSHVYNGTYSATVGKTVALGIAAGLGGQQVDPALFMAPARLSGAEMKVIRMKLAGTKKRPIVWMECELLNSKDKANTSGILTIADYDAAIRSGEIYNPQYITHDIAVARLLEAQKLFEIGIYTQQQLDETRAKYARFVTP